MTEDDSPQHKPSGTTNEQNAEATDHSDPSERSLAPDYGAFGHLNLDHEAVDTAEVVASLLRGSAAEPFGLHLTTTVGPVTTEITFGPEAATELAQTLADHSAELADAAGSVDFELDTTAASRDSEGEHE